MNKNMFKKIIFYYFLDQQNKELNEEEFFERASRVVFSYQNFSDFKINDLKHSRTYGFWYLGESFQNPLEKTNLTYKKFTTPLNRDFESVELFMSNNYSGWIGDLSIYLGLLLYFLLEMLIN